jgi:hypothetical protein
MAEQNIKTQPAATNTYPMGRAIIVLPTYEDTSKQRHQLLRVYTSQLFIFDTSFEQS